MGVLCAVPCVDVFVVKQKTAYELRISDWSSDVCSSDLFRMTGISERVWTFAVSGYPLLYKWLKARTGEPLHGERGAELLQEALDVAWRIEELLSLFTEADSILARVLDNTLTREELNMVPRAIAEDRKSTRLNSSH